ncbi:MAG: hypothetical protein FJ295_05800 [Planctomycetes bacterium]|nr:hypothetical protein [Planctomycetota bacterium]
MVQRIPTRTWLIGPPADAEWSRRRFLATSAGVLAGAGLVTHDVQANRSTKRPRVAAIFTSMTYRSHAHVILENFLEPYLFNGRRTDPGVEVVSFYSDQSPGGDMAPGVSQSYNIPIFKTIDAALCLGGKELAVDAVLSIGEHGSYQSNELSQVEYPRKRFFDEIVATMKRSRRFVPVFNDKHLSYRWDWAKEMYDTARELEIPFLAGSSVPLAERRPPLELPAGSEIEEAVSIHGGPLESYDFHGLELLQSMVESRKGGETGISRIEFLPGNELLQAAKDGRWSMALAVAAMADELGRKPDTILRVDGEPEGAPHALLVHYKDGLKATVLCVGQSSTRWNFACRLKGDSEIRSTAFNAGPWQNRCLFKALSHAIQHHFVQRRAPYPVERTLLVTGALEAAMRARQAVTRQCDTPHLEFAYAPSDFHAMREMGASWKIITEQMPQPDGIHKLGNNDG